ncbi:hypothetical protein QTP88_022264 [Uroleucon formosanum]
MVQGKAEDCGRSYARAFKLICIQNFGTNAISFLYSFVRQMETFYPICLLKFMFHKIVHKTTRFSCKTK